MLRGVLNRAAALLLVPAGLVACGFEPGSGACTQTRIAAPATRLPAPTAPLALTGTLTAGDTPVRGAELAFFVRLEKPDGKPTGVRMGEAMTTADGVATFERQDGVDGLGFTDERATGYTVEFNPLADIEGVQYCRSRTAAALEVG
jgi:hypothetical protein